MVKYMKKAKEANEVVLMEVAQSSLGVRTRAKTLALQKLKKSPTLSSSSSGSYLQLRSRRLQKPPIGIRTHEPKRQKQGPKLNCVRNPNVSAGTRASTRLMVGSVASESDGSVPFFRVKDEGGQKAELADLLVIQKEDAQDDNNKKNGDLDVEEASFGENVLEFEGRETSRRESTPSSLIRDPDTIQTPGSTTRATSSTEANKRIQNQSRRHIPTANEMDEFFSVAEEEQHMQFIEKYNFDPVKEKPLPGRFHWEKVDP